MTPSSQIPVGSEVRVCVPGRRPSAETYQVLAKGLHEVLVTPMPGSPIYGKVTTIDNDSFRLASEVSR